jgi:hypothetical protein
LRSWRDRPARTAGCRAAEYDGTVAPFQKYTIRSHGDRATWVWINVFFAKWNKNHAITLAVIYLAIFIVVIAVVDIALCLI